MFIKIPKTENSLKIDFDQEENKMVYTWEEDPLAGGTAIVNTEHLVSVDTFQGKTLVTTIQSSFYTDLSSEDIYELLNG